jgi:predicted AAA+ superfamily ATPase
VYALFERKRYYIFVTGSSSKLLGREIATQLRGRAFPVYVYPFSFRETLRARGVARADTKVCTEKPRLGTCFRSA